MDYKSHVPAGVLLTGVAALIAGAPAVVPFLLGGAFGGALPDIDIEGSAVQSLGSKAARGSGKIMRKVGGRAGRAASNITSVLGLAIDSIFLRPICRAWRIFAEKVLGRIYEKIYAIGAKSGAIPLGKKLHWDSSPAWAHRGGLTHSFIFLLNSCLITVPLSFLLGGFPFWLGCEIGIISHLVADSMCRSGVKFFWPFIIPIGFPNRDGEKKGDGMRILPFSLQVKTGAAQKTRQEINAISDETEAQEARRLKRREIAWRWFFRLSALGVLVALFMGVAGPGGIAWSFDEDTFDPLASVRNTQISIPGVTDSGQNADNPPAGQQPAEGQPATPENQPVEVQPVENQPVQPVEGQPAAPENQSVEGQSGNPENRVSPDIVNAGGTVAGVNPIEGAQPTTAVASVPEHAGPRSLTYGDVPLTSLPKGIIKLPDESLWIVGVGPVTPENLENPRWVFTDAEKQMLLRTASAQRLDEIPNAMDELVSGAANALDNGANATGQAANEAANSAGEGVSGIMGWLQELTGLGNANGNTSNGAYDGGFLGITPYTK